MAEENPFLALTTPTENPFLSLASEAVEDQQEDESDQTVIGSIARGAAAGS